MVVKRILLTAAALAFSLGVLTTSVWKTSAQTGSKNYKISPLTGEVKEAATEATPPGKKKVDYFLVYPGILPDHFLYPLKMIRDRIWLWLTVDPLKKAELLLLFADKRLGAGRSLVEGGKMELGVTTLTKAEKYLERAVNQEKIAREKGRETTKFLEKLLRASQKHEEVLLGIKEKVPLEAKGVIESTLGYARRGYEQVKQRLGKD